jgi:hypothetical protein
MSNQSNILYSTAFLLLLAVTSNAQLPVPFWSEDFTNGIPAGWTTADASGQNVLWTWCPEPTLGNTDPGCSPVWNDGINMQEPFNATTAYTGFVTVDSDQPGNLPQPHISELTTGVIDCSGKSEVFVTFQTHIGVYAISAETGAILRVSTDQINWTAFTIFPGLTTGVRWSKNIEEPVADISSVAANQPVVYIQWQWTGDWEYFWNIDDIAIYDENPTARFNLVMSNFFYPASSYATPASQIATDTFGFFITLSNKGLEPMTNIVVKATVEDTVNQLLLFADSVAIDVLDPGVVDSFIELPNRFVPALGEGEYLVSYSVRADSADLRPNDNDGSSPFIVTSDIFSKEDEVQSFTRTAQDIPWNIGNFYLMANGLNDQYKATVAEFAFETDTSELAIEDVTAAIYFFKVADDVASDFSNFDLTEFPGNSIEWLGFANYQAPPGITDGQLQQVDIIDFDSNEKGVALEPGGRYFLMAGYPEEAKQTNHAFNRKIKYYDAISTVLFTDQWYLGGFGDDFSAVMRMYISLVTTTDEKPLPASSLKVFPSPVKDNVNLDIRFDQPTDVTITIADLTGRVITMEDRQGVSDERRTYNLSALASGAYLARIATKDGSRTLKFVVQQ